MGTTVYTFDACLIDSMVSGTTQDVQVYGPFEWHCGDGVVVDLLVAWNTSGQASCGEDSPCSQYSSAHCYEGLVVAEATDTPAIDLVKTGTLNDDDGTPGVSAGDTVSYAFTVTNTGSVTLTNITLADTVGGVTILGGPIASLAPAGVDTTTFTGSYEITQANIDAGQFDNTATVTGTPPSGPDVSDPDDETVYLPAAPAIELVKTGTLNDDDGTPGVSVGDTVS
ncbi:hypothetical protein ACFLSF_03815, partial [Candidatus Bipolaricaulota bacterium]